MSRIKQFTQIAVVPDDSKPTQGRHGITKKWNSSLTIAAREAVPPAVMVDWLLAIMEGYGTAVLKRDERVSGGWTVVRPDNGPESTDSQKQWAWLQWRLAGYGQPVQQVALDADLRQNMSLDVSVDPRRVQGELSYVVRQKLLEILQPKPELDAARLDVVEAELVETE